MKIIRILHECEVLKEKSQGSQFGITWLCRVMLNCDPRDRFLDQYLTLMIDSFLAHLWVLKLEFYQISLKIFRIHIGHFDFVSFSDIFVTSRLMARLHDIHYNQCLVTFLSDPQVYQFYPIHVQVNKMSFVEMGKECKNTLSSVQENMSLTVGNPVF